MDFILLGYLVTCLSSPEAWEGNSLNGTSFGVWTEICAEIQEGSYGYPGAASPYSLPVGMGLYKFNNVRMTWLDARRSCADDGSHLVILETADEAEILGAILWLNNVNDAHIGYFEDVDKEIWKTVAGESVLDSGYYLNWAPNEPNNHNNIEDCANLRPNGELNDIDCNATVRFLCEKPLPSQRFINSGSWGHGTVKNMWLVFIPSPVLILLFGVLS